MSAKFILFNLPYGVWSWGGMMSFKRGSCHLLALALLLCTANIAVGANLSDLSRGVLWQITKPAGKPGYSPSYLPSYLLGTIHSDSPRVTLIPEKIQHALNQSRSFTAELDMNMSTILEAQKQMMLPLNINLAEIIGASRFKKASQIMGDYGVPESIVARMKPWAIAAQISLPKPTTGLFLDLKLFQQAQARGMRTYGLETVSEQMNVFNGLSTAQQITMLDEAIQNYKVLPQTVKKLIDYYLNRDLAGMQEYSNEIMAKGNKQLSEVLQEKLIIERNKRMAERMNARLVEGSAFIAVGALHLPGDNGILNLLQMAGYRVEPVY